MAVGHKERCVYSSATLVIRDYQCRPHSRDCTAEEQSRRDEIAFVRRGVFTRHAGRESVTLDAHTVAFFNAGQPYRVSHPVTVGDDCSVFCLAPAVLRDIVRSHDPSVVDRPDRPFRFVHGPSSARAHLAHQQLLCAAASSESDPLCIEESAMELADAVLSDALAVRGQTGRETRRSDTTQAHRGAVDAARHIMAARYSDRLLIDEIAHAVHLSPFHLSRVFRRETGLPLHRYATSLRLRAALDRLADRRVDLTMLALDLGFSSYNHFSTAFRRAFNLSPAAFRRNLTSSRMREMSKIVGV